MGPQAILWDYRMLMRRWGQKQLHNVRTAYEPYVGINQLYTQNV